jgi:O-antigen/teichoic acid export membrane protein
MKSLMDQLLRVAKGRNGTAAVMQSLVVKLVVITINTATGIITARMLRPDGRGELAAMILWPVFLTNALTLGLPSSLIFNLRRSPERESHFFSGALVLGLILGVVAGIVGALMLPYWLAQYHSETVLVAQWIMFQAPQCTLILVGRAALEARGEYGKSNATLFFIHFLTLVVLLGLMLAGKMSPFLATFAYVLNGVPAFVWMMWRLWKIYRPRWDGITQSIRELLPYGLRAYGIDLLGTLSLQIDQVMVVGFLYPAAMGTYVVALNLSRVLQLFQQAVVMVLFPKASARPVEEVLALTGRAVRISSVFTALAGIGVLLWGQWLLRLLYGREFVAATNLLRLLTLEAILSSMTLVLAQAFMALGKPGTVTILQGLGLALSVPLMLVFIPRFGLLGTGISLAISSAVRLVLMLMCFPWLLKERAPNLLFGHDDWMFLRQQLVKIQA